MVVFWIDQTVNQMILCRLRLELPQFESSSFLLQVADQLYGRRLLLEFEPIWISGFVIMTFKTIKRTQTELSYFHYLGIHIVFTPYDWMMQLLMFHCLKSHSIINLLISIPIHQKALKEWHLENAKYPLYIDFIGQLHPCTNAAIFRW